MKEQMINLMIEQATMIGTPLPESLARRLLDVMERCAIDTDRRAALRQLSEAIAAAQDATDGESTHASD